MTETAWPDAARIVEVGPRDGLQNEAVLIATTDKAAFIRGLIACGLREIEATSFVNPKAIPQLADADSLMALLTDAPEAKASDVCLSALAANERGLDRALASGVSRIALFTAASDAFAERNIGQNVAQSLETFSRLAQRAQREGVSIRGYVSTCFVCPYQGEIEPEAVLHVSEALLTMGADEVSLGDTVGLAVPTDIERLLTRMLKTLPAQRLALHCHDTSGTALANITRAMQLGLTTFDASAGGLGGCPYAPGASGNVATEDVAYLMQRMGVETGVNLTALAAVSQRMESLLGRSLPSRQLQRLKTKSTPEARASGAD
ncbi:MAG: hydroxymethylglutaryl-CoA lyase [Vampirovibrionales bacterium]|nr:hydroxymethylglutaryl-CoA lyase [Vampirovibrionales bacterium]